MSGFSELSGLEILELDVDYLRMTTPNADMYMSATEDIRGLGAFSEGPLAVGVKDWYWLQYHGWQKGRLSFGLSYQGSVGQESGVPDHWDYFLARSDARCTRVDVQCTLACGDADGLIRRLGEFWAEEKGNGKLRAKPRLIEGYGEGNTLYLGSRKSERMIRVYNKEKESEGRYPASVRIEVEFKGEQARSVYAELARAADRATVTGSYISGVLETAHVVPPALSASRLQPGAARREDASAYKTLRWLERSVRPAIRRLRTEGVSIERIMGSLIDDWE